MTDDLFNTKRIPPLSPKLMTLRNIGVDHAIKFNLDWHSRLPETVKGNLLRNKHYVFFGAEYMGECFASAIWTTPVANNRMSKDFVWLELRRLAIPEDAPKFTATWMIAKMIKEIKKKFPDVTRLVSYQDTAVHTGTIYAAANWIKDLENTGGEWNVTRVRKQSQAATPKNRWIYNLK